ncbi:PH domain-containing protein [Luteolibacter pohnpeiensis]|uniref:PH domain-containing protein n=1 Tax=Luteolibacter pohnpeiensis TaxID=454153 RepID=A0A934S8N0_9BACT|nr:PH domain-containing protein [Luteolibacter pohnpeiensis]MBK1881712.1 PH domain-containing protein [Luteolibacter pohnpeiensis]
MSDEVSFWKTSPSQWLNLGAYLVSLIVIAGIVAGGIFFPPAFIALVLPLAWIIWKYMVVKCQQFELTNERLKITSGVINQHIEEVELYRVKDTLTIRPWWMRVVGLATIKLETSDRGQPKVLIPGVKNGVELRETLRKEVERQRDKKRVREMDFNEIEDEVDLA